MSNLRLSQRELPKFDYKPYKNQILKIFEAIDLEPNLDWPKLRKILSKNPKDGNSYFSKDQLVQAYYILKKENLSNFPEDPNFVEKIQLKPVRTQSGVTPVTVLTKPFPCPGQCIFCPNDIRMPKSYLSDEPGAQRAERNNFDPYLQTYRRIKALYSIGHNVDKIEIIILGGTWSFYPESYQIWFIKRIFEALNNFSEGIDQTVEIEKKIQEPIIPEFFDKNFLTKDKSKSKNYEVKDDFKLKAEEITELSKTSYNEAVTKIIKSTGNKLMKSIESSTWKELELEQKKNEIAKCKCVGLVIETRPDKISPKEVIRIRKLGCTKAQIGIQSLQNKVLNLNKRGHDVKATRYAIKLLRQAGFKIHAHWMANLYGSTTEADIEEYKLLFSDPDFKPDELKIYPCSLIETAELMDYYQKGLWKPYTQEELLLVVSTTISQTPEYCRLTRIIRDIPGTDIVVGNKVTNFRELAEKNLDKKGFFRSDIRSREIKNQKVSFEDLELKFNSYKVSNGTEIFIQFVTKKNLQLINPNQIVGFLRLNLPEVYLTEIFDKELDYTNFFLNLKAFNNQFISFRHPFLLELSNSGVIREVHVYGKSLQLGNKEKGRAQHLGLGTHLLKIAEQILIQLGYPKIAVISAIGTRNYYRKFGYELENLYQIKQLQKI